VGRDRMRSDWYTCHMSNTTNTTVPSLPSPEPASDESVETRTVHVKPLLCGRFDHSRDTHPGRSSFYPVMPSSWSTSTNIGPSICWPVEMKQSGIAVMRLRVTKLHPEIPMNHASLNIPYGVQHILYHQRLPIDQWCWKGNQSGRTTRSWGLSWYKDNWILSSKLF
jgi:hypothetical protein